MSMSATDRAVIKACQAGLPLVPEPYAYIAETLGMQESELRARLDTLMGQGIIRRIGIAPNH